MLLLIDAYNLLHQSDALQRPAGQDWLHRSRRRLIDRLAEHLDADLARQTCLVFDARVPPPGAKSRQQQRGMQVLFAVNYPEADDLLEELIRQHPTPKRLAVVSSDHRVQRAARRRGARAFDADRWYARLVDHGPRLAIDWPPIRADKQAEPSSDRSGKPDPPRSEAELHAWLRWFGTDPEEDGSGGAASSSKAGPQPPVENSTASESPLPADDLGQTSKSATSDRKKTPRVKKSPSKTGAGRPAGDVSSKKSASQSKPGAAKGNAPKETGKPPKRSSPKPRPSGPKQIIEGDLENPFPEGYGEDLLDEE